MWLWKATESPRSDCRDDFLCSLQDHTQFLGFNIKTKSEPKFLHQLLSSARPFPGAADALWIPGQLSWEQPGQLQSSVLFGL